MIRRNAFFLLVAVWTLQAGLFADNNPSPTQSPYAVNPPYAAASINQPFPDAYYGADHGGSSITLSYPYTSQFGYTDHSRGVITYNCAPFTPRGSEGVYGMDVWLEQQDSSGNWSPAALNGGVSDQGVVYQPVNTPNPGPSPSYQFTWTFYNTQFPAYTNFRIFVYVYLYNQGGGSQGNFYVATTLGTVNTGAANDTPRINWASSSGAINPTQVQIGQSYTISANGQDDNGNLVAVSINKNGQPFAYAGGGNGYSGNSQNPTSDPQGTVTYSAWATDSYGLQSPTITWTVNVIGKSNQAPISSTNVSIPFYSQAFTPPYYGGSGSGGWQFVIAGYTNFDGGASGYTGTNLGPNPGNSPGAVWVPSWNPPGPGSYQFWVARDGDNSFNPASPVGPYTLTVTAAAPVGSFDGVSPSPVTQGQTISGSGWAADAQMGAPVSTVQILVDGGAHGSFNASLGGYRPDVQSANLSWGHWSPHDVTNSGWSFGFNTSALGAGAHTFTAVAYDSSFGVSATIGTQSFSVSAPAPQTVTISPTSQTVYAGTRITFTASGGVNGYIWGGSASGSGSSQAVTFSSPGTYSVTVYSPGGGGYAQSPVAVATITVTTIPTTFTIAPTSFTYNGASQGPAISASPSGASYSISGTASAVNAGTYSLTVTAIGNYSGSSTVNWSIAQAGQAPVSVSPGSATVSLGQSVTFSASGGSGTGVYVWGGSASGTGPSNTVTFPNTGTYAVSVYRSADANYRASNTATATITVNSNAVTFSASTTSFTYNGSPQGPTISSNPPGATYSISGTAAATNVGIYSLTATANGSYSGSNSFTWAINPANQAIVSVSPATATVTAGQSVTFTASGGSGTGGFVWGGQASGTGSIVTIAFPSGGSYTVTVYRTGDGNFIASNTASAAITVISPTYSLTVLDGPGGTAVGSATGLAGNAAPSISATANSGFAFVDWTGDPVTGANTPSTTVPMNNADRTVTANFTLLQAQTISFNPPATAVYPGPVVALSATASSGLPVGLVVASGPASLAGNVLTLTGNGTVVVQASQGGGWNGGVDYLAAPNVSRSIQVNAPFTIIRIRFNSPSMIGGKPTGNLSLDANNVGHSAQETTQPSLIWTDPAGIQSSPWPSFGNPGALVPSQGIFSLPLAPAASVGASNSTPGGSK